MNAGLGAVQVSPRIVYVNANRPLLVDGFIPNTFTAVIEGIREPTIASDVIKPEILDAGLRDLERTAESDGVPCYTFFKGSGTIQPNL